MFITQNKKMQQILATAKKLIGHTTPVLICGATGTGKEVLARHLHIQENNPNRPFVAINCAALPDNLIEAELFGAEKGAFTGANELRRGLFEIANGGDIFLDEIDSLKTDLQAKLLRVVEYGEFYRLGSTRLLKTKTRIIAATNTDLSARVKEGRFREDLFYRLSVINFELPSLKDRPEDIVLLMDHYLTVFANGRHKKVSSELQQWLTTYAWPGNIRELKNLAEYFSILSENTTLGFDDLPAWIPSKQAITASANTVLQSPLNKSISRQALKSSLILEEARYIQKMIDENGGNIRATARQLGMGKTTIYMLLKKRAKLQEQFT